MICNALQEADFIITDVAVNYFIHINITGIYKSVSLRKNRVIFCVRSLLSKRRAERPRTQVTQIG